MKDPSNCLLGRLEAQISAGSLTDRVVQRVRLRLLNLPQILRHLPRHGEVYDLGCGFGLVAVAAALAGCRVIGVDLSPERIEQNRSAFSPIANLHFEVGNLESYALPQSLSAILLVDVLHYFSPEQQNDILIRSWQSLAGGGRLVVRDVIKDASLRFLWNAAHESLLVSLLSWTKTESGSNTFLPKHLWLQRLESLQDGSLVCFERSHRFLPYNDTLMVVEKAMA